MEGKSWPEDLIVDPEELLWFRAMRPLRAPRQYTVHAVRKDQARSGSMSI